MQPDTTMRLRDQIATAVLPVLIKEYFDQIRANEVGPQDEHWRHRVAFDAYMWADALIAMRSAKIVGDAE